MSAVNITSGATRPSKYALPQLDVAQATDGETSNATYRHDDWTLFRSLDTLAQKAGVPVSQLAAVVAKELVDNALDAGASVRFGLCGGGTNSFWVQDDGPGLPGTPQQIAELFSIARPLVTSKLIRRPTRGALGNGLRVVAGAVLATGGHVRVETRGQALALTPQDDGATVVSCVGASAVRGTRVAVELGPAVVVNEGTLTWARCASILAQGGEPYKGKTSPHWYDDDSFFELLQAAGQRPVRTVITEFDGCTGAKAGQVAQAFLGRAAASLSRPDASTLLHAARALTKEVTPQRLGKVGPRPDIGDGYSHVVGVLDLPPARGQHTAHLPVVVEAWVSLETAKAATHTRVAVRALVNRTSTTHAVEGIYLRRPNRVFLHGCGLSHTIEVDSSAPAQVWFNIQIPYMPRTSDGKAPDLERFAELIKEAVSKAARVAKRARPQWPALTFKAAVYAHIPTGQQSASGGGAYVFPQRNLFYDIRDDVAAEVGSELTWQTFTSIVTDYENEHGDIPLMYRDPRGTVHHPHSGEDIPLGTLAVARYRRPAWTFNKVLYIEKEGFFEMLKSAQWPERHDCALLTSKGQASRAAKDLLDLLGGSEEPVSFFCIHDADTAGTVIYQALQEATRARPGRTVQVVNLGLEPWEAMAAGMRAWPTHYAEKRAVARYVTAYDAARGTDWAGWLQQNYVELNALGAGLIDWLDAKMARYSGKVVPPAEVLEARYRTTVRTELEDRITARILKEADAAGQVEAAYTALGRTITADVETLCDAVVTHLDTTRTDAWSVPVEKRARERVHPDGTDGDETESVDGDGDDTHD